MTPRIELTILMPCLNEEETLGTCIKKAQKSIAELQLNAEILIADNGSTDMSVEIAKCFGARVINVEEKGYGNALLSGIENAKGDYIIMGDSDDSYDFSNLHPFIEKLRAGYELVMGNRFKGGIEKKAMPFMHKYLGNPVLSSVGRLFFKIPVNDFHCGLRGFNRSAINKIGLCTTGMEFASEMVVKSSIHRLKITEVPTKLYPDGRSKPPHLRTWNDGWRHLRFLLLYSPKWLFLYPGIIMSLLGIVLTIILFAGPVSIGKVTFDIHTMLYSSMMVIAGLQVIAFYFQAKIVAIYAGLQKDNGWLQYFKQYFSLEKGIICGGMMLLAGISLTIYSITIWKSNAFGNLDPSQVFRWVIPSVSSVIVGIGLIFNSFFMSTLTLKTKNKHSHEQIIFNNKTEDAPVKAASIY
ncbi:MAG: glycosyltransferase family 2 protein [Prolixibacteraceae bacterium]|jgi:glycosyltransferase involved in cell wall biosynthesis|nr:glycosyltransferase family 2 protein [Prolixibacteraceae bacterium]